MGFFDVLVLILSFGVGLALVLLGFVMSAVCAMALVFTFENMTFTGVIVNIAGFFFGLSIAAGGVLLFMMVNDLAS